MDDITTPWYAEIGERSAIDVPLLRKHLQWATDHPSEWNQRWWGRRSACGSAYCLAGHVVVQAGYDLEWWKATDIGWRSHLDGESTDYVDLDGYPRISTIAAKLLGLSASQARQMFAPTNTIDQLWRLASQFTDGEIAVPITVEAS